MLLLIGVHVLLREGVLLPEVIMLRGQVHVFGAQIPVRGLQRCVAQREVFVTRQQLGVLGREGLERELGHGGDADMYVYVDV